MRPWFPHRKCDRKNLLMAKTGAGCGLCQPGPGLGFLLSQSFALPSSQPALYEESCSGRGPLREPPSSALIVAWQREAAWASRARCTLHTVTSILQEIGPECSLDGLMLKLKRQYSDHLM